MKGTAKGSGRFARITKPGDASFAREGEDFLVRSGASKKGKKVYSHRVPSELIEDLCFACMGAGKAGASFTMDDLKEDPELKAKGHSEGYYYDVLRWFKVVRFVEGAGPRGRYKLGEKADCIHPHGFLKGELLKLPDLHT